jgi:hypothetical protein
MTTPLPVLRKRANDALIGFSASTGHDPEGVWEMMMAAKEMPELLTEYLEGAVLWDLFQTLRNVEISILKNSRP